MSLAEKIGALMQRPSDDLVAKDEVPWWLKYSARAVGTVAGGLGIVFGVFNTFTNILFLSSSGIIASLWLVLLSLTVLILESPCCFIFINQVQDTSNWVENRPYWNRAAYYMIASLLPLILYISLMPLFCSILIFCTGLLYGMMALGRKASPEEMRNNAASIYSSNNQQFPPAATSNSNLVGAAHPVSKSNPFDSQV